jgi:protein MpaA
MRLDVMSAGARRLAPRRSAGATARSEAGLGRHLAPHAQVLVVLGTACGLLSACTSSWGRSASLLAELTAPGVASPADPLSMTGSSARAAQSAVRLGGSVKGVPLVMEVFGDGPERVLVVGGMHGNEPAGAIVADGLARLLDAHPELVEGFTVAVFATVNPDGLLHGQRTNANGVDLNRNFPSADWCRAKANELPHGRSPGSEPETVALMRAVEIIKPHRIIDMHSIMRGSHGNNYDGPAEPLAELMSRFNGYPVLADVGYATPGALSSWAAIDRGIPTVTLELPSDLDGTRCWSENAAAVLAFIRADFDSLGE